jgi:hypothetical protein
MVDGSSTAFDVDAWAETPYVGDDPVIAYDAAVAHALAAFGAPGAGRRGEGQVCRDALAGCMTGEP